MTIGFTNPDCAAEHFASLFGAVRFEYYNDRANVANLDGMAAQGLIGKFDYPGGCYSVRTREGDLGRVEGAVKVGLPDEGRAALANGFDPEGELASFQKKMAGTLAGRPYFGMPWSLGDWHNAEAPVFLLLTDYMPLLAHGAILGWGGGAELLQQMRDGRRFTTVVHRLYGNQGMLPTKDISIRHYFGGDSDLITTEASQNVGNGTPKKLGLRHCDADTSSDVRIEHGALFGLKRPDGAIVWVVFMAASYTGKTTLPTLQPSLPKGWDVVFHADDILVLFRKNGRLYAAAGERGLFGVAKGTNIAQSPRIVDAILRNGGIMTNVGHDVARNAPHWRGLYPEEPKSVKDWRSQEVWDESLETAQANGRFCISAYGLSNVASDLGAFVPVDIIVGGVRRPEGVYPLIRWAGNSAQAVYMLMTMTTRTTAAAVGDTGVLRMDPFGKLPFLAGPEGNSARWWLDTLQGLRSPIRVGVLNYFTPGFPGFGHNAHLIRILWESLQGAPHGVSTPIGIIPRAEDFEGALAISPNLARTIKGALQWNKADWLQELAFVGAQMANLRNVPKEILREHAMMCSGVNAAL